MGRPLIERKPTVPLDSSSEGRRLRAHLGRLDEARELLRHVLELQPDLRIAGLKVHPGMTVTPEIFKMWAEGFRKAGLPEE
jgi:hypothetical protein